MKVLHLSTWSTGGAAIASTRLSAELNKNGVESKILHMSNKFPAYVDAVISKFSRTDNPIFRSFNFYGQNIQSEIAQFQPDVLHIHWIGAGFITPESLAKFDLPIVWTLHDLWPMCGASHLPLQGVFHTHDLLDRLVWSRKQKIWPKLNLTFVAPSNYLQKLASKATIANKHQIVKIGNGVDINIFKPGTRKRRTILFVAMNPGIDRNKGYSDFKQAIALLPKEMLARYDVKVVGGEVTGEKNMANLYREAVVTVIPSRIENLPFVAMESLACGTPVVAYRVGGIPDLVEHGVNGYLASPYDVKDLARGIEKIIASPKIQKEYGIVAREKIVKCFDIKNVAKQYLSLYQELI